MGALAEKDFASRNAAALAEELAQERLWLRAALADPEDFSFFYEKYADRLRGYIRRRIGDRDLADDLLGMVFTKALEGLSGFRWRGVVLGAWLHRIAAHEISDHLRRAGRVRLVICDEAGEAMPAPGAGALAALETGEAHRAVRRCLLQLADRDRRIFRLHYWEGLKTREVAARLRLSENTVKTRLARGRGRLRSLLAAGPADDGRAPLRAG